MPVFYAAWVAVKTEPTFLWVPCQECSETLPEDTSVRQASMGWGRLGTGDFMSVPSWWHSPPIKMNPCHWGFPEFSKTLDNLI